ncbi:MAG TPA: PorV/PorQ family protein [Longimicrobiales bacterium]
MDRLTKTLLPVAFILVSSAGPLLAQDVLAPGDQTTRVATRGANFLTLPVGAKSQGMAGSGSALASGIPALYWNTAAIAFDEGTRVGLSYSPLYGSLDITHSFAGFILPLGTSRIGLSLNVLSSGEILATSENYPEGNDPDLGVGEANFEWNSTAVGLHLARPITDRLAVGIAGKYITEGISGAKATFVAVDLSTIFHLGLFGSTLAASYVNIGTEGSMSGQRVNRNIVDDNLFETGRVVGAAFQTRQVELPAGFYFGFAMELVGGPDAAFTPSSDHRLTLALDGVELNESPFTPRVGFEYGYRDLVFLRAGKRWSNELYGENDFFGHLFSFGGGLRVPMGGREVRLDYAYTEFGQLDNVQVFSFELAF